MALGLLSAIFSVIKAAPLSVKIVIDFGPVIAVHGRWGVIESRQQVRLDIPHLGRVVIQAVKHILHMGEVHFQEAAFYYLTGVVIPGNADIWPLVLPHGGSHPRQCGYMAVGRGRFAASVQPVRPHAHTRTGGQEPQIQYFL